MGQACSLSIYHPFIGQLLLIVTTRLIVAHPLSPNSSRPLLFPKTISKEQLFLWDNLRGVTFSWENFPEVSKGATYLWDNFFFIWQFLRSGPFLIFNLFSPDNFQGAFSYISQLQFNCQVAKRFSIGSPTVGGKALGFWGTRVGNKSRLDITKYFMILGKLLSLCFLKWLCRCNGNICL